MPLLRTIAQVTRLPVRKVKPVSYEMWRVGPRSMRGELQPSYFSRLVREQVLAECLYMIRRFES